VSKALRSAEIVAPIAVRARPAGVAATPVSERTRLAPLSSAANHVSIWATLILTVVTPFVVV
jgi:hypothetical protein